MARARRRRNAPPVLIENARKNSVAQRIRISREQGQELKRVESLKEKMPGFGICCRFSVGRGETAHELLRRKTLFARILAALIQSSFFSQPMKTAFTVDCRGTWSPAGSKLVQVLPSSYE